MSRSGSIIPAVLLCIGISLGTVPVYAQWNKIGNIGDNINLVKQIDNQLIYAAGYGAFKKSTDGGLTWTESRQFDPQTLDETLTTFLYTSFLISSIEFRDSQTGYLAGWSWSNYSELILKTTDGGTTWSVSHLGQTDQGELTNGITGLSFVDDQLGYASSLNGRLLRTTDGGSSWNLLSLNTSDDLMAVQFVDGNNGYALSGTKIFKTTNGGSSWSTVLLEGMLQGPMSFAFVDHLTGFLAGQLGISKTNDGGVTWVPGSYTAPFVRSLYLADAQTAYAAGPGLYKTFNGGDSWYLQVEDPTPGAPNAFQSVSMVSATEGVAVANHGNLYNTSNGGGNSIPTVTISSAPPEGIPTQQIFISGINMQYIGQVVISDIPCVIYPSSSAGILVVVPDGATIDKKIEFKTFAGSIFSPDTLRINREPILSQFSPSSGNPGTQITITGGSLSTTSIVTFNGTPAQFAVVDNHTLTAVIPHGATTGPIVITTAFGTATSIDFTIYPLPNLLSFSPTHGKPNARIEIYFDYIYLFDHLELDGKAVSAINGFINSPLGTTLYVDNLPANATSGKFKLVTRTGVSVESAGTYTVEGGSLAPQIDSLSSPKGMTNDEITLYGNNFMAIQSTWLANHIYVNQKLGSYSSLNDSTMIFEIPHADSGPLTIKYYNYGNQLDSINVPFNYIPPPALTAELISYRWVKLTWEDKWDDETGFYIIPNIGNDVSQVAANVTTSYVQLPVCGGSVIYVVKAKKNAGAPDTYSEHTTVTSPGPGPLKIYGNPILCWGDSTKLTADPTYHLFFWYSGFAGPHQDSVVYVKEVGTYSVYANDTSECTSFADVHVQLPPAATISRNDNTLTASPGDSYTWYFNGNQISNTGQSISITGIGTYQVAVTSNGCASLSELEMIDAVMGLDDPPDGLAVYPNPTTGKFSILNPGVSGRIRVVNNLGIEVNSLEVEAHQRIIPVDLSGNPSGLYLLKVGDSRKFIRVVLTK